MSDSIPLGKKEDSRLEFKGADALKDPEKIAREVVAMLNADRGEVWVGLREEGGRAVGVEPILDPEREERRLWDFLLDTIEPSVSDREVRVQSFDEGEGAVLRIAVSPKQGHKPYAFLKKGGRHFVTRVGDRIRPMTREEVLHHPASSDRDIELAERKVLQDRNNLLAKKESTLWLRLQPEVELEINIQDPYFRDILLDPSLSENRFAGYNFSNFHYRPIVRQDKLITHPQDLGEVEIRRDGGLVFATPFISPLWKDKAQEIWSPMLIECVVSAFKIAKAIYIQQRDLMASKMVVSDLVLTQIQGWKLPARPGMLLRPFMVGQFLQASDFTLARPLLFRFEEIEENPDRCGYRLVERIYEDFGIEREYIPFFDKNGRFVLDE